MSDILVSADNLNAFVHKLYFHQIKNLMCS